MESKEGPPSEEAQTDAAEVAQDVATPLVEISVESEKTRKASGNSHTSKASSSQLDPATDLDFLRKLEGSVAHLPQGHKVSDGASPEDGPSPPEEEEEGAWSGDESVGSLETLDPANDPDFRLKLAGSVLFQDADLIKDEDELGEYIPEPPDGGYGWIVVAASFLANLVVDGIGYSFGIFMPEFQEAFGVSQGITAIVGSLLAGSTLLVGPIVSGLVNQFGARIVMIAGALLGSFSLFISVFSPSITVLMLTFGVMGGAGFGLIYLPAIVHTGQYFEKKRALATGLAVAGSGAGTFLFAPLSVALINAFGWKGAMWILAGAVLNCAVFGAILLPLKPAKDPHKLQTKVDFEQKKLSIALQNPALYGSYISLNSIKAFRQRRISDTSSPILPSRSASRAASGHDLSIRRTVSKEDGGKDDSGAPGSQLPVLREGEILATEDIPEEEEPLASPDGNFEEAREIAKKNRARSKFSTSSATWFESYASSISRISSVTSNMAAESLLSLSTIKAEDFSKPLYRQDIFYAGSVANLPEFQARQAEDYRASTIAIPQLLSEDGLVEAIRAEDEGYDAELGKDACWWMPRACRNVLFEMMGLDLLRHPVMALLCLSNIFGMLGFYCPFVFLAAKAVKDTGVSNQKAALLLSVIGVANTLGRIVFGWLSDRRWVSALTINNACLATSAALTLLLPFLNTFPALVAYSCAFGFSVSAYISLTSIILVDYLGLEHLSNSFGLLILARGLACMAGSPLGGVVYDVTGSYDASFVYSGSMLAIAALISAVIHLFPCLPCFQTEVYEEEQIPDYEPPPLTPPPV